jgi:O-methyltransferase
MRNTLLKVANYIAWKLPTSIIRPIAMPIAYQTKVADGFMYENGDMINTAIGYCSNNKMKGNFAEFGVFKGKTTIEAWKAAYRHGLSDMNFWLFDSFEGLPEVKGIDAGGQFVTNEFSNSRTDYENRLKENGLDFNRLEIVEGFFDESLPKTKTNELFSVVFIDCDLYESTVPVLNWLTDKLVDGAVLCFDDWYCFNGRADKGEQKATAEWLEANPSISLMPYREFHWGGKSFLVHTKK